MPDYHNQGYAHITARISCEYRSKINNIRRLDFALKDMILSRSDYLMSVPFDGEKEPVPALPQDTVDGLRELLDFVEVSPYEPILTATVFLCGINGRVADDIGMFIVLLQELGFCPAGLGFVEKELRSERARLEEYIESALSEEEYSVILEFVIVRMERAYAEAMEVLSAKDLTCVLDRDSREILLKARDSGEWFTVSEAVSWARGPGEQTVRARLSQLVNGGLLDKEGNTRSTRFRFSDPFRDLKRMMRKFPLLEDDEGDE